MQPILTRAAAPQLPGLRALIARRPLATFFVLAFCLTWSFLIADALGARGLIPFRLTLSGPGLIFALLMSYGPTFAALIVTAACAGRSGLRSLLGAVIRWRVGLRWYVLALAGPAALFFVAARFSELLEGGLRPLPAPAWMLLLAGAAGSMVHGITNGEELGWRGFALPHLLQRHRAFTASLILGAIWAAFHLPIMFVPSSVAGSQSFETAVPFFVGVLALSPVVTWLYQMTRGSLLLVILLHGSANAWPQLLGGGSAQTLAWVQAALLVAAAAVVLARYGPDLRARDWPAASTDVRDPASRL